MSGADVPVGGSRTGRGRGGRGRGERAMVPPTEFASYYGRPVLKKPVWRALDIAGYLFLGGLAGGSSVLAAGAAASGRHGLARPLRVGAFTAISLSLAALVHDLGRPARFLNMLRVMKPTSPMSMGSWLLTGYAPLAGAAAASTVTGRLPRVGAAAGAAAALLGPAVASYTAVLISDTAVPTWHDGHREMPFVFCGSAATAAAGLGLLVSPAGQNAPARRAAAFGAVLELGATELMRRRMGLSAEPLRTGRAGQLMRASRILTCAGTAGALVAGRRARGVAAAAGAALLAGSAALRFGVFQAGVSSAEDPKYTVLPQRERLAGRAEAGAPTCGTKPPR
ncbi:polysulfide reductase NrfD [Streptomyces sp. RB6PN23]|uniref:Polysulfide reductase NrfD n=2 Tax=Streptomyces silvisoli TaxID=3034235 RepID=A0ABT5ZGP4_9ACTN|nr:NrfD/PsrC family molybdoenzyme membrane anchor subunit [Streptomyces silvisoli]MDF3288173.1 polysulfide reductase NrfD [Streptomyces silvisoli]